MVTLYAYMLDLKGWWGYGNTIDMYVRSWNYILVAGGVITTWMLDLKGLWIHDIMCVRSWNYILGAGGVVTI